MDSCRESIIDVNPQIVSIAEVVGLDHLGATEWGTEGSSLSNHYYCLGARRDQRNYGNGQWQL